MGRSIAEWREQSPYWLAKDADCAGPDSTESEGAQFLASVRDSTLELLEQSDDWNRDTIDDDGSVHQIADDAPSIYTHTLWKQFVDLAAYFEDPELGEWPDDLNKVAGIALCQIAERLAWAIINDVHEWREESASEDDEDADTDAETDE